MKGKELIRRLQEADPTGEIEVCVGNADIFFVDNLTAFWDGSLQVLDRDVYKQPYFDVVGAKRTSQGRKIQIHTLSIDDLIWDFPDIPIDYSELGSEERQKSYRTVDDLTRKEVKEFVEKMTSGEIKDDKSTT